MQQQKSRILLIETSTSLCSAALAEDGRVLAYRESSEPRAHAAMTAPYVKDVLDECSIAVADCTAVCVSSGPGSYTGLRVGVSTAKGLCFGAGIPLLSVDTMEILVAQAYAEGLVPDGCRYIVPMIDARRMEVYACVYECESLQRVTPVAPEVVDGDTYRGLLEEGKVLFIGDGALKCRDTVLAGGGDAAFVQCCPKASAMAGPAEMKLRAGATEDVAYFEPFYLKEFIATVSKKSLF
ncbi:MAG: tRNA (adenosine(37)-N6)-threonylcarbamoyltransferase complex dimerization subunit type 1 TsaB [Candidatus Cryptobacteroides sp.]